MKTGAAKNLRRIIEKSDSVLAVGIYDALTAKMVENAGFPLVYVSGASVSMSLLGLPDLGLNSFGEIFAQVQKICFAVETPVIVDADTGYGNALNVRRTFRELEAVGAAGIQFEDQIFPKKCGHLAGTQVVEAEEMVLKIEAAIDARENPDTVLIARTDARQSLGLDEAIRRANLYKQAGADMIFLEGMHGREECEVVAEKVDAPLIVNTGGRGLTPKLSLEEFEKLGFKFVLHPGFMQRTATLAMKNALEDLRENGNLTYSMDAKMDFDEWFELVGISEYKKIENKFSRE